MLDGLLGRGFSSKCKSLIKLTKSRIDVIRRKRNATQKFLKKDIADLLSNGLDINAYGRADGLLAELTLSSCYDYIEQTCDFVLKHLSVIQKQRECPEECREAVSSLMFAAARFSDLPELRDLRQMFQERYGNSLEYFANKEFVEKLSSKPAKRENKVQLMRDIASEFSISWDSVAFEQRMSNPSASVKGQNKNYGSFHVPVDNDRLVNAKDAAQNHKFAHKERIELPPKCDRCSHDGKEGYVSKRSEIDLHSRRDVTENGHASLNGTKETVGMNGDGVSSFRGRQEITVERHGPWIQKEEATPRKVRLGSSSHRKGQEFTDDGSKIQNGRENIFPKRVADVVPVGYSEFDRNIAGLPLKSDRRDAQFAGSKYGGQDNTANSSGNGQAKEVEKLRPYYNNAIPPPYVKPNSKPKDDKYRANLGSSHADFGSDQSNSTGNRSERVQLGDHSDNERHVGLVRTNGHVHEKDHHRQDDVTGNPLPKPKSVRRRHSRSRSNHDDVGNSEDTAVPARKSRSSKRRDDSRRGLQILFGDERDEKDEEERVIDRLLMHYSKKPTFELEKLRRKSKSRRPLHEGTDAGESPQHASRNRPHEEPDMAAVPLRSASLPREQPAPSEAKKVFARAASFQPDRSNPARHVHPKLPDYDDLAARFASLKGGR